MRMLLDDLWTVIYRMVNMQFSYLEIGVRVRIAMCQVNNVTIVRERDIER